LKRGWREANPLSTLAGTQAGQILSRVWQVDFSQSASRFEDCDNSEPETQLVNGLNFGHTRHMTKRLSLLILLLFVASVHSEPFKLDTLKVGTTTYNNVVVLGSNTTDLYFRHSLGFANVKLKYLSPDLQKRFAYDPKAAAAAEKLQSEEDLLYQSKVARAEFTQAARETAAAAKPSLGSETGLADPVSEKSLLGKPGPKLEVDKWLGDKPALEGKFVLLSFWAPWSMPCKQSIPELNALQKKYADKLVVVGVSTSTENEINDMAEPHIDFALAVDAKAKLSAAAGVTSIPYVLLCDPKGVVLYQGHPGAINDKKLPAILARSTD
jgi:cytochrome c biogenesis protein CcmG/thiol:disulfide interchange protein DsbE